MDVKKNKQKTFMFEIDFFRFCFGLQISKLHFFSLSGEGVCVKDGKSARCAYNRILSLIDRHKCNQ